MLVYDGDCGFCTSSAMWIAARLPDDVPVEPWQALDLDAIGLTPEECTTAAYWVDHTGAHRGHRAIGRSLIAAGGFWKVVGWTIIVPPVSFVARAAYAVIAKNRHRLPGSTDACRLPA